MDLKYLGIGFGLAAVFFIIKSSMSNATKKYMTHDAHDDEDIEALAKSGRKMAVIKAFRKLHGVGLKQAKEAVDAMLIGGYHDSNHIDDEMNLSVDEKILRMAKSGHKIQAIKIYRETYGVGLKYAKDAVDNLLRNG